MTDRSIAARRGWERRRERAHRVETDLPPDLIPLYRRLGCPADMTAERLVEYAAEHPHEAIEAIERGISARWRAVVRSHEEDTIRDLPAGDAIPDDPRTPSGSWIVDPDVDDDVTILPAWTPLARRFLATPTPDPWEMP